MTKSLEKDMKRRLESLVEVCDSALMSSPYLSSLLFEWMYLYQPDGHPCVS